MSCGHLVQLSRTKIILMILRKQQQLKRYMISNWVSTTEQMALPPSRIIIFTDELNKYASKDTPKPLPILREILDVTERGRSLGVILFGTEQF